MASFDAVPDGDFDISIVVCGNASKMPAALSLASVLATRRDTTLVLAPAAIIGPETVVQGALVVAAPGNSPFANLALLARAIIAPVLTESMVCVDWADLLTVLDDGTQAMLVAGKGASPGRPLPRSGPNSRHRPFPGSKPRAAPCRRSAE